MLFAGLLLWSTGVQINEAVASLGLVFTALGVLALYQRREPRAPELHLRLWWPLLLFFGWAVAAPALAGRPPTAAGVARGIDWLFIPVAAIAVSALQQRQRHWILRVAGAVFLLSCALAALQHFGLWPTSAAFARLSWT